MSKVYVEGDTKTMWIVIPPSTLKLLGENKLVKVEKPVFARAELVCSKRDKDLKWLTESCWIHGVGYIETHAVRYREVGYIETPAVRYRDPTFWEKVKIFFIKGEEIPDLPETNNGVPTVTVDLDK